MQQLNITQNKSKKFTHPPLGGGSWQHCAISGKGHAWDLLTQTYLVSLSLMHKNERSQLLHWASQKITTKCAEVIFY